MKNRNYNQFCSLAKALDILGERWSLLIIRDLIAGPRRYKDLFEGLPGIGTNLLAKRLQDLVSNKVIQKTKLPAPYSLPAYELTPLGHKLEPALVALASWGLEQMPIKKRPEEFWSPNWNPVALKARFNPKKALGLRLNYSLCVGEFKHIVVIENNSLTISNEHNGQLDGQLSCSEKDFLELIQGKINIKKLLEGKKISLLGPPKLLNNFLNAFN